MSIILGIDPGSRITGYGVIRQVGRQLTYLGSGCIRTKVDDLPSRLKLIYAGVTEIITQFQPDYFAIEQVFMAKNADSALKLDRHAAWQSLRRPIRIYRSLNTRPAVKQTVVGIGSAEKASPAYGAHAAKTPGESASGCRGCAGDCYYPLPCQSECHANERVEAEFGARSITLVTNEAGYLSSLFMIAHYLLALNAGASRDRQTQRHHY